ncbi:Uncharacterized protein dnm_033870 [Desulfonema magnum]|uniref:Uncharacterized protein n=1 Tax=Desulfonema magnum TaxID=45655 RepID=A0A975BLK8_9BACT|nr:Uncharacterized protein dnm_033870 [Desulfonema magnum]
MRLILKYNHLLRDGVCSSFLRDGVCNPVRNVFFSLPVKAYVFLCT